MVLIHTWVEYWQFTAITGGKDHLIKEPFWSNFGEKFIFTCSFRKFVMKILMIDVFLYSVKKILVYTSGSGNVDG